MASTKPTANWEKLGSRFYRKVPLYTAVFDADLELQNYLIAGAPYSGAVAFYRNEDRIATYRGAASSKTTVDVYSCSGKLLNRLAWDKGTVKGLGWGEDEMLVVVAEDGVVRCYEGLGADFVPFSLGHGAEEHGVLSVRFWSQGFVALLGNNHLVAVNSYAEPRPRLLALPPNDTVHAWTLIPPQDSLSRSVEVLLAIRDTVFVADATDCDDRGLDAGPFRHVAVSPNGRRVALYTDDGKVWVISSDFQNRIMEYDSKVKTVPKDLQWCGNDAVALAWEDEVHLVGSAAEASKFYYDGWVCLLPDVDGIRIVTNDVCEFLQRVPGEYHSRFGTHMRCMSMSAEPIGFDRRHHGNI
jgi:hypothetical protein